LNFIAHKVSAVEMSVQGKSKIVDALTTLFGDLISALNPVPYSIEIYCIAFSLIRVSTFCFFVVLLLSYCFFMNFLFCIYLRTLLIFFFQHHDFE